MTRGIPFGTEAATACHAAGHGTTPPNLPDRPTATGVTLGTATATSASAPPSGYCRRTSPFSAGTLTVRDLFGHASRPETTRYAVRPARIFAIRSARCSGVMD